MLKAIRQGEIRFYPFLYSSRTSRGTNMNIGHNPETKDHVNKHTAIVEFITRYKGKKKIFAVVRRQGFPSFCTCIGFFFFYIYIYNKTGLISEVVCSVWLFFFFFLQEVHFTAR